MANDSREILLNSKTKRNVPQYMYGKRSMRKAESDKAKHPKERFALTCKNTI